MEAVLSRGQGKAATAVGVGPPLFVDWMESGCQVERVVSTRVSLICAGWLPQDGTFESEWLAVSNTERNHLCCRAIAHRSGADPSNTPSRPFSGLIQSLVAGYPSSTASDQHQPASSRAIAVLATTARFLRASKVCHRAGGGWLAS